MNKINNPDTFRENVRQKISALLKIENEEDSKLICGNIEKSVFNYAIDESTRKTVIKKWDNEIFVLLYLNRLRSIYTNLKNEDLSNKIKNGDIQAVELVTMSHQEMEPTKWTKFLEIKCKRDASKFNVNVEASTDVYICRRCKSRKCTYEAVQIRSSDEPMTIFVNCLTCGKNWTC
jgi:DNA-directed RNA polymerase subunit M/transcription elongation factor TFIIS